jgi:hypothetical protein
MHAAHLVMGREIGDCGQTRSQLAMYRRLKHTSEQYGILRHPPSAITQRRVFRSIPINGSIPAKDCLQKADRMQDDAAGSPLYRVKTWVIMWGSKVLFLHQDIPLLGEVPNIFAWLSGVCNSYVTGYHVSACIPSWLSVFYFFLPIG